MPCVYRCHRRHHRLVLLLPVAALGLFWFGIGCQAKNYTLEHGWVCVTTPAIGKVCADSNSMQKLGNGRFQLTVTEQDSKGTGSTNTEVFDCKNFTETIVSSNVPLLNAFAGTPLKVDPTNPSSFLIMDAVCREF